MQRLLVLAVVTGCMASSPEPPGEAASVRCRHDDECASTICAPDTSACVDAAAVVYASPTGGSEGDCTQEEPCAMDRAVAVATTAAVTPTLRLLPGTHPTPLTVAVATERPLVVVATGARLATSTTAIVVTAGASVQLRGVTTSADGGQIVCGGPAGLISTLTVRDSILEQAGRERAAFEAERCRFEVSRTKLAMDHGEVAVRVWSDATGHFDLIQVTGEHRHDLIASGQRIALAVTSSLIEHGALSLDTTDAEAPGSTFRFDHVTFAAGDQPLRCGAGGPYRTVQLDHSIITNQTTEDAVEVDPVAPGCTLASTLVWPQAEPPPGGIASDPRFVDPSAGDYHLRAASPAIDAADVSPTTPPVDLDGIARPQGAGVDLGAYERAP